MYIIIGPNRHLMNIQRIGCEVHVLFRLDKKVLLCQTMFIVPHYWIHMANFVFCNRNLPQIPSLCHDRHYRHYRHYHQKSVSQDLTPDNREQQRVECVPLYHCTVPINVPAIVYQLDSPWHDDWQLARKAATRFPQKIYEAILLVNTATFTEM